MYEDGAGRKVKRLDRLLTFIVGAASKGCSRSQIVVWAERNLGLSEKRIEAYLRLLSRTHEIIEDGGRFYGYEKRPSR